MVLIPHPCYNNESFLVVQSAIADLIFEHNKGILESELFSQFSSFDSCYEFLKGIENNIGCKFENKFATVLKHKNDPIGVCIGIKITENYGYIADIGISPAYQGRGLGKALFNRGLKNFLRADDSIQKINLNVVLSNEAAHHLYSLLGFQETGRRGLFIYLGG